LTALPELGQGSQPGYFTRFTGGSVLDNFVKSPFEIKLLKKLIVIERKWSLFISKNKGK